MDDREFEDRLSYVENQLMEIFVMLNEPNDCRCSEEVQDDDTEGNQTVCWTIPSYELNLYQKRWIKRRFYKGCVRYF